MMFVKWPRLPVPLVLLFALAFPAHSLAQSAAPKRAPAASPEPYKFPRSEVRTLQSKNTKFGYRLYVSLPEDYAKSGDTRYPVLYLLDGPGDWVLATVALWGQQSGDKQPRQAILVGIGYDTDSGEAAGDLRGIDMTPTPSAERDERLRAKGYAKGSGGASAFLRAFKEEFIPFIEANYRTSGERLFGGYSLGGLFGAYVLFHDPQAFSGYLLGSPSLWWDNNVVIKNEAKYAAEHHELPARVFMSFNSEEIVGFEAGLKGWLSALKGRSYEGFDLTTHFFDGENHLSGLPAAMSRGVRVLLAPIDKEQNKRL